MQLYNIKGHLSNAGCLLGSRSSIFLYDTNIWVQLGFIFCILLKYVHHTGIAARIFSESKMIIEETIIPEDFLEH